MATLTESEATRYDRQIRVWGAEAQYRIQHSRVLVSGLQGLNAEVCKNIVLAGINIVVLVQDSSPVASEDLSSNFFSSSADLSLDVSSTHAQARIQELNKFTNVEINARALQDIPDSYFLDFDVIVLGDCDEAQALRINKVCRSREPQSVMFWSSVFGMEGVFISDFGDRFEFTNDPPHNKDVKLTSFPSLLNVLSTKWSQTISRFFPLSLTFIKFRLLASFSVTHGRKPTTADISEMQNLAIEMLSSNDIGSDTFTSKQIENLCQVASSTPVMIASILGSFLSQEIIKAASRSGSPGLNVFTFSGDDCVVKAIPIGFT